MRGGDVEKAQRRRHDKGYPWDSPAIAASIQDILNSLEITEVDAQSSQRILNLFGEDGPGHVITLLRTITESEGNGDALIEPIVSAVSSCMRPKWTQGLGWIEAFDKIPLTSILETMRGLDVFSEGSLGYHFSNAIWNKLAKILDRAETPKAVKAKADPKPPRVITQVGGVAKNIALGLELLDLRRAVSHNLTFGRQVRLRFNIDAKHCADLTRAARVFGTRPEIHRRLSWNALVLLSSPTLPAPAREALEARIRAGKAITAAEIRAAHRALRAAKRQADQAAVRMAA